ncbi:MAG: ABC transporter ATP-binding protein [Methyloceanibacter sp.]|jgi:branched-chain amino acid transport system ATP-binding protein
MLLEAKKLEVVYKKIITAVRDVSIQVEAGAIVGIAGLNGAGKTSTLRAISGFVPGEDVTVREGEIRFTDMEITGWRPDRTAALGIALIPERRKIFETLTVRENLEVAVPRTSSPDGRVNIKDIHELFPRLYERRNVIGIYLSGGEQQMLAIAMGLLGGPKLLMVDEASLGLAPKAVGEIMDLLVRINREFGTAILVVDQDVEAIFSIASQGYIMEGGRIVFAGATDRLLSHSDVREFYLGLRSGEMRSYRDAKQYRRSRRWWA